MLKKIVMYMSITVVILVFTACAGNSQPTIKDTKSNKFRIDELVLLPHPGKFIKQGKIKLNSEQKDKMKVIKKTIIPDFQNKMRDAFILEKKLRRAVANGKSKESLKTTIDEIAKLKREALDVRLDALYELQKIFTKEQWEKVNKLTYQ